MRLSTLNHTKMARELAVLRAVVSTVMMPVLGHLPSDTFHVEVVSKLAAKF
jgi:hypothetical protein